jgi:hypothetical protein
VHEFNKPLREGLRRVFFVGVVRGGSEGVCVDVFSDPHGSFSEGGVSWGDSDVVGDRSGSPAGDDEGGEPAVVLDKVAGAEVMAGDNWGQGSLLAELGDLLLEVTDRVLIGSGLGDEGPWGGLGDASEGLRTSSSSEGLKDSKGWARGEGRGDIEGRCDRKFLFFVHFDANTWWRYREWWECQGRWGRQFAGGISRGVWHERAERMLVIIAPLLLLCGKGVPFGCFWW